MSYIDIFSGTSMSIGKIKSFNLCAKTEYGNSIDFPISIIFQTGGTDTVKITDDFENREISFDNGITNYSYKHIYPKFVEYTESEKSERQGVYYLKTLKFRLPRVNATTNNQLKDFLFTNDGNFAISNCFLFFTDGNNNSWISGIDLPFTLTDFQLTTGARGGENYYEITYESKSYNKTFQALKIN